MSAHSHPHTNDKLENERVLKFAFFIIFSFMLVEVVGGVLANSLALLADAGHMMTDAAALAMAWMAFVIGRKPPDRKHSYGHQRYQVVAALLNGALLIGVVIYICIEAYHRFTTPSEVKAPVMLLIATIGLLVNILTFWLLHRGEKDNLNIRGAMLHVLSDLLGSVAAIIAGLGIYFFGWHWLDPSLSLVVAALIVRSGIHLIKDSLHILLEGVPDGVNIDEIKQSLIDNNVSVENIHHVHAWSLNNEETLMTLHVKAAHDANHDQLLQSIHQQLKEKFNVTHATVQIEHDFCSSEHEQ